MKTKNELFIDAVDYLIDKGLAVDQADVAQQAGLGPNLISRVRNGKVKNVSDDSIRAIASKFNLNIDYFRGKSEYITHNDNPSQTIDHSSLVNAMLAAKDQLIEELQNKYIKMEQEKDARIADLEKLAEERLHRIAELRRIIDTNGMMESPFPIGSAEPQNKSSVRV